MAIEMLGMVGNRFLECSVELLKAADDEDDADATASTGAKGCFSLPLALGCGNVCEMY